MNINDIINKVVYDLESEDLYASVARQLQECSEHHAEIDLVEKLILRNENFQLLERFCRLRNIKNDDKAAQFRIRGNEQFNDKNYNQALKYYNESLCYATPRSEDMALGYGHRSAVMFQLKRYNDCIMNIILARKNVCSERLKLKLLKREHDCVEQLRKVAPDQRPAEFSIQRDRNPKIPFIADCLELTSATDIGRQISTKSDLKVGEVVAIEDPYCSLVLPSHKYVRCANCLKEDYFTLTPCENCCSTMFCSTECAEEANKTFHKYECPIIFFLLTVFDESNLLALRTTISAVQAFPDIKDLMKFHNNPDNQYKTVFNMDYTNCTPQDRYRTVNGLMANEEHRTIPVMLEQTIVCAIMKYFLFKFTPLSKYVNYVDLNSELRDAEIQKENKKQAEKYKERELRAKTLFAESWRRMEQEQQQKLIKNKKVNIKWLEENKLLNEANKGDMKEQQSEELQDEQKQEATKEQQVEGLTKRQKQRQKQKLKQKQKQKNKGAEQAEDLQKQQNPKNEGNNQPQQCHRKQNQKYNKGTKQFQDGQMEQMQKNVEKLQAEEFGKKTEGESTEREQAKDIKNKGQLGKNGKKGTTQVMCEKKQEEPEKKNEKRETETLPKDQKIKQIEDTKKVLEINEQARKEMQQAERMLKCLENLEGLDREVPYGFDDWGEIKEDEESTDTEEKLLSNLEKLHGDKDNLETDEESLETDEESSLTSEEKFFTDFLFHHIINSNFNKLVIKSKNQSSDNKGIEPHSIGIYPFLSLLSHSCAPNTLRISQNSKIYLFVLRPIPAGGILYDSFGPHFSTWSKEERKDHLQSRYSFECSCEACTSNYSEMINVEPNANLPSPATKEEYETLKSLNYKFACENYERFIKYLSDNAPLYPCEQLNFCEICFRYSLIALLEPKKF